MMHRNKALLLCQPNNWLYRVAAEEVRFARSSILAKKNRPPWMAVENLLAGLLLSNAAGFQNRANTPHKVYRELRQQKRRLHSEPPEPN
jgi:hypothetical protein